MASQPLTPVQLVDQAQVTADDIHIIIDLRSYGAPIRLRLDPNIAGPLSSDLLLASRIAMARREESAQVIPFPGQRGAA